MPRKPDPNTVRGPYAPFGDRLRQAFDRAGIQGTYKQIGKSVGVSGTTIGNLLLGKKLPSTDLAVKLAKKARCSHEWLMTGRGTIDGDNYEIRGNFPQDSVSLRRIPLISLDQAVEWCTQVGLQEEPKAERYIASPIEHTDRAFAYRIPGSLMDDGTRDGYPSGSLVQFEPDDTAVDGEDVLVHQPGGQPMFRRLMVTDEGEFLVAINRDAPNRIMPKPADAAIIAVATGYIVEKKRKR